MKLLTIWRLMIQLACLQSFIRAAAYLAEKLGENANDLAQRASRQFSQFTLANQIRRIRIIQDIAVQRDSNAQTYPLRAHKVASQIIALRQSLQNHVDETHHKVDMAATQVARELAEKQVAVVQDTLAATEQFITSSDSLLQEVERHALESNQLLEIVRSTCEQAKAEVEKRLSAKELPGDIRLSALIQAATDTQHALQMCRKTNRDMEALLWKMRSARANQQRQLLSQSVERKRYLAQFGGADPVELLELMRAGKMPAIPATVMLQPGEQAYFSIVGTLYEDKAFHTYVGQSARVGIPLGHGFRLNVGSHSGRYITTDKLTKIDQGQVFVTSERLVYNGARSTLTVPFKQLVAVTLCPNGIDFRTTRHKMRQIITCANPKLLGAYLLVAHEVCCNGDGQQDVVAMHLQNRVNRIGKEYTYQ